MVFLCALAACKQPSAVKPMRDMGPSHDLGGGHMDMGLEHNPDLAECSGVMCEGACVDTLTDGNNCGSCGNVCQGGATCQNGSCQGGQCGGRMVLCEGICTDITSDPNNCGACGQRCNGSNCSNGICGGGQVTGCNGLIQCVSQCGDGNCANACVANSTPHAQQLLNDIYVCLDGQCPQMNGGICDPNAMGFDMNKCNACVQTATMPNGPCGPAIAACMNDLP
jgi:hypothetical protein